MKPILRKCRDIIFYLLALGIRISFKALRTVLGQKNFLRLHNFVFAQTDTTITVAGIRFDGAAPIPLFRAVSLLSKEPDTIAWIEDFVKEGETLYDVGANVGVYSLFAATRKNAKVIAFEPSSDNYAILNKNIFLNGLSERITAFNIALHNSNKASVLNHSAFMPGKAGHGFDIIRAGSDYAEYIPAFQQGVIGLRLDQFVQDYDMPFPNHVKIDVDGNDPLVIEGMAGILTDSRLRSIAVEINPSVRKYDLEIHQSLEQHGFQLLTDPRYKNVEYDRAGLASNAFYIRGLA
jgi:FkbM family methyltransferase